MADVKISGLPVAAVVEANDLLELSEETGGGSYASRKATAGQLRDYVLSTPVSLAQGGTGATDAPTARSNLVAAASGAIGASGLTMGTARLLGRSSANAGPVEEITLGSGLSLAAGILSSAATDPIPSGTAMLFVQSAAPTGWTKSTTHNDKALRVVSGPAGTGGVVAFTTAFASQAVSGTVGNTTLTTAQMPAHSHSGATDTQGNHSHSVNGLYSPGSGGGGSASNNADGTSYSFWTTTTAGAHAHNLTTYNSGGGQSHTHAFTGTAINLAVQYVDVIIAMKD